MFFLSKEEDIKEGKTTDIYFQRTAEILEKSGRNPQVSMEIFLKKFPEDYGWGIFCGLSECLRLLDGIKGLEVYSLPEGKVFSEKQPLMLVKGRYLDFGRYETAILGFLCHASGIATKAARVRSAAGGRLVYNFGARRAHPGITPMIERSAYIGGLDGVSTFIGGEAIGIEPVGTMPHALILILGDTLKALNAFDDVIAKEVPRIALLDTYNDEKFEALNLAQNFKGRLYGLRFDTPGSRRGDLKAIIEEVQWELGTRGYKDIKFMVSGGLDEKDLKELNTVVDAFGVGTSISNAKVLDFSMDIVKIDGKSVSKRGKSSGEKKVIGCKSCGFEEVVLFDQDTGNQRCPACGGAFKELYINMISDGKPIYDFPDPKEIRKKVIEELEMKDLKI